MRREVFLLAAALAAGCSSPTPTGNDVPRASAGIVLSLSSQLPVGEIDGLVLQIDASGSPVFAQSYSLPADATLPATLVLEAPQAAELAGGTLPPGAVPVTQEGTTFHVSVRAQKAGVDVVVRSAELTMPSGVKTLAFPLETACASVTCPAGQTCSAGACVSEQVDTSTLPPG